MCVRLRIYLHPDIDPNSLRYLEPALQKLLRARELKNIFYFDVHAIIRIF
jgi:hypothetical protein